MVPAAPVTKTVLFDNLFIFLKFICFLFKILFISLIFKSLTSILSDNKFFFSDKYLTSKKFFLIFRIIRFCEYLTNEGIVK